jgi:hypothetical protein
VLVDADLTAAFFEVRWPGKSNLFELPIDSKISAPEQRTDSCRWSKHPGKRDNMVWAAESTKFPLSSYFRKDLVVEKTPLSNPLLFGSTPPVVFSLHPAANVGCLHLHSENIQLEPIRSKYGIEKLSVLGMTVRESLHLWDVQEIPRVFCFISQLFALSRFLLQLHTEEP